MSRINEVSHLITGVCILMILIKQSQFDTGDDAEPAAPSAAWRNNEAFVDGKGITVFCHFLSVIFK